MNRERLLKALQQVKHGLASKEIMEQSMSFIFRAGRVMTYNDEVTVSTPVEVMIEGAVPAEEFLTTLSKLKGDEIEIEMKEGELQIVSGKFTAGIRIAGEIKLPLDEINIPEEWNLLPKGFEEGLKFCLFSASTDMSRPILCCIHVKGDVMESCDNYRLSQYRMDSEILAPMKLPTKAVKALLGVELNGYSVAGENWIHFKTTAGAILSFRTIEGDYPDLSKLMDFKGDSRILLFPEDTNSMVERVDILAQEDLTGCSYLKVKFADRKMFLRGEGEVGWAEEIKEVSIKEDIEFRINPDFLIEILSHTHKALLDPEKTRLKFEGLGFIHVLALAVE